MLLKGASSSVLSGSGLTASLTKIHSLHVPTDHDSWSFIMEEVCC